MKSYRIINIAQIVQIFNMIRQISTTENSLITPLSIMCSDDEFDSSLNLIDLHKQYDDEILCPCCKKINKSFVIDLEDDTCKCNGNNLETPEIIKEFLKFDEESESSDSHDTTKNLYDLYLNDLLNLKSNHINMNIFEIFEFLANTAPFITSTDDIAILLKIMGIYNKDEYISFCNTRKAIYDDIEDPSNIIDSFDDDLNNESNNKLRYYIFLYIRVMDALNIGLDNLNRFSCLAMVNKFEITYINDDNMDVIMFIISYFSNYEKNIKITNISSSLYQNTNFLNNIVSYLSCFRHSIFDFSRNKIIFSNFQCTWVPDTRSVTRKAALELSFKNKINTETIKEYIVQNFKTCSYIRITYT